MDILDELQERTIPGDGPLGVALCESGTAPSQGREGCCLTDPDRVLRAHEQFIAAGARLIRTNSFAANALHLEAFGLENRVNELNWTAAKLARQAVGSARSIYVAGSVGPIGLSKAEATARGIDREALFRDQIGALLDGGVHLVIFQGFADVEELALALYVKQSLHHCPAICSIACPADGELPCGTSLADAIGKLKKQDADLLGLDSLPPEEMTELFRRTHSEDLIVAFPMGTGAGVNIENFVQHAGSLIAAGAKLIGGGDGTGPEHIAALVSSLAEDPEP